MIELLVVIAILGILGGIAMYSFLSLRNSARDAAQVMVGALTQARTSAMSNTLSYRLVWTTGKVRLESALSCTSSASGWTVRNTEYYVVPDDVTLSTTVPVGGVLTCYNSRGLAVAATDVVLKDKMNHSFTVRSYFGGAVRVVKNAS